MADNFVNADVLNPSLNAQYNVSNITGQSNALANQLTKITQSLDGIIGLTEKNTAKSIDEAEKLRDWQVQQNRIAMEFNAAEAAKNRDWQMFMSNTAHQREVNDLMAAGLNPVLSAGGGNGAAVTSGATASGVTSSGAKGEVDTSATAAVVGVLGSMLSSLTNIANANTSAIASMANTEKLGQVNQLIAQANNANALKVADLYGKYGIAQAATSGQYSLNAASVHANASKYAADKAYLASKYATDANTYLKENYPSSFVGGISSIVNALFGQDGKTAMDVLKDNVAEQGSLFGFLDWLAGSPKAPDPNAK